MNFGGLKPWKTPRQRELLRACFHVDAAKAEQLAARWFAKYELDDASYEEHRLLVRLHTRFPDYRLAANVGSRITGLKRQLWVRGNINFKAAKPAFEMLTEFGIQWVLTGAAQWFLQPERGGGEAADIIEITVPEPARSTALHLLAQNGWQAGYTTPDAAGGPVFTQFHKGQCKLKLSKVEALMHFAPDSQNTFWETKLAITHELGAFYTPDFNASCAIAAGRTHPKYQADDQWVFDLFGLNPDPLSILLKTDIPAPVRRKIARSLKRAFYA